MGIEQQATVQDRLPEDLREATARSLAGIRSELQTLKAHLEWFALVDGTATQPLAVDHEHRTQRVES
jgi:hypothetical protein